MDTLLEKMIKDEKSEELARLDAINIVNSLFSDLMDREKDILVRRFGLKGDKEETLEKIGNLHKLTRERVRQIESASIKKIKKLDALDESISILKQTVFNLLDEHGGLVSREYLLDILTVMALEMNNENSSSSPEYEKNSAAYRNHFNFLISKLMNEELELVSSGDRFNISFKAKNQEVSHLEELAEDLMSKVELLKKTYTTEELLNLLKQLDSYNKNQEKFKKDKESDIFRIFKSQVFPDKAEIINANKVLYSFIQAIKNIEQNKYGEWGLADSQEIKPKTINDKIYLVLKHEAKPMHFTAIADKINEIRFDKKQANAATVHNELILDNRYVLVSRGTYGLKEWVK